MDGSFAVIFLVAALGDMIATDCAENCIGRADAPARIGVQGASVLFQYEDVARELFVTYDRPVTFGPFQPTLGVSVSDERTVWVGYGARWQRQWRDVFLEASLMPGLYAAGDGPEIGGALHFRSGVAVGYRFDNGGTVALTIDHRSNADIQEHNPGLETVGLRYSFTLD